MPSPTTSTRAALVEAAVAALRELEVVDLLGAIGTRAIATRAGVSAATLFHHFGSTQTLAEEVLQRVFDPRRPFSSDIEIGTGVDRIEISALPSATSLEFHAGEFDRLSSDEEHPLRIGLWALGGAAGRAAYGTYLRERDAPLHAFGVELYDSWARELRPPMDIATFVAVHAALLNGSVIRGSVDSDTLDRTMFARSAATLSLVMLRVKGERRDLDDRLAEINYYPMTDSGNRHQRAEQDRPQRHRVVAAAQGLFWERGYDATTLGEVARTAGLSLSAIHVVFAGKADLAVTCLLEDAQDHLRPEPMPWRERLTEVASFLARSAHLIGPYAEEVIASERDRPDDVVLAVTTAALSDVLGGPDDPDSPIAVAELAHTVLVVLLGRLIARPADGAAGAVAWVERVVLAGLLPTE